MIQLPDEIWLQHVCPFLEATASYWIRIFFVATPASKEKAEKYLRCIGRHILSNQDKDIDTLDASIYLMLQKQKDSIALNCDIPILNKTLVPQLFAELFTISKTRRKNSTIIQSINPLISKGTIKMCAILFMYRFITQSRRCGSLKVIQCLLNHPSVTRV